MTKRISFPVVGSFNEDPILKIDAQRSINLYEIFDQEAKKPHLLIPTPGLEIKTTFPVSGKVRAGIVHRSPTTDLNVAYFVVGNSILSVDSAFVATNLSGVTFTTTVGHVGIAANETQIAFVDGIDLIIWDIPSTTLSVEAIPTGVDTVLPQDITFMDGYFIVVERNANIFYISALGDGRSWAALDFALVNSSPTTLIGCSRLKRRLFLFGETITEVWLDAGAADFPFRRDNNLLLEHGLEAPASLVEGFDRLFYLSRDDDGVGAIMMVEGTFPKPISTREVDETIQTFSTPSDATGMVYKINGQIFYQINFTADDRTFIYNVNMNKWHEMQMLNETRHLGDVHVFFQEIHLMGSYVDQKLYDFSENFLDNDGEAIKRTRICKNFNDPEYRRIRIDRFQLDMLQGVGITNPNPPNTDDNPQVHLSISEDGGITYHNFGTAPIGKLSERLKRTIWRRLGVRRDSIIKLEIFNKVKVYILGAAIDAEVLPE